MNWHLLNCNYKKCSLYFPEFLCFQEKVEELYQVQKLSYIIWLLVLFGCKKEQEEEYYLLPPLGKGVNVMETGAVANGIQDDTPAFEKAMQIADSLHMPVIIPAGTYRANIRIPYDNITLNGQLQPSATFSFGTRIIGSINCNNKKYITLQQLGVDNSQLKSVAAILAGDGIDSIPLHHQYKNITILGGGYTDFTHGILCQTGGAISMRHIIVKNCYHGIAIRSSNITADSIEAISCGFTSIIIKSAETKNAVTRNVSVKQVTISGNSASPHERGGMILVQSFADNCLTENIEISEVNSSNGGIAAVFIDQSKGKIQQVKVSNCVASQQGDIADRACFEVKGGSQIQFTNCTSNQSTGTAFRCSGNAIQVRVAQSFENGSGTAAWQGNFSYLQLNGVEIIK